MPRHEKQPSNATHSTGDYILRVQVVDASGNISDLDSIVVGDNSSVDATGSTVPANATFVAGSDGTSTRALKTDSGGELQVDVLSIAAGTNAIGKLAANSGVDIGDVDVASLPAVTPSVKSSPIEGSGTANVTTSTTTPVAANAARLEITLVNDSDTTIYLALGEAAVLNSGIRLNANGGSYSTDRYTGDIRAIHGGSGNKVLTWVEL